MSKLPYMDSKCDPVHAQQRIRQTLIKFGVDRIMFDEDFKAFTIYMKFRYKDYPVCIPVNYEKIAKKFMKSAPLSYRARSTREKWESKHRDKAYRASFSIIEDFIKSMITMVELDVFTFEEIFISYFMGPNEKRLGEYLTKRLPDFVGGRLALPEGE
ncbi:MAG: hypothetical protein K8I00_02285 [Candidatus Omnitrophica bacterium]|nr:hypothetical protein [Candidatus Omnitrophota bacterium]